MAIILDLITKPNEASLRSSSTLLEKHFATTGTKAGEDFSKALAKSIEKSPEVAKQVDKLADITGRLRVEQEKLNAVNAKDNATAVQKIQAAERVEKVQRDLIRSTRETALAYDAARVSAGGFLSTLSSLSAGTRFGGIISSADTLAAKFGGVGLAAGGAIAGVAAIGIAAVTLTKQLYDVGKMWDDVGDSITAKTGKVGDELQQITDQIGKVASRTAVDMSELAGIYGQSMQSLRLSGSQLDDISQKIAELNNLTGDQTNIRQLGLVFRMFGVNAGDQVGVLNGLYSMFQQTGIPVNELLDTLQKSGPVLSELGMNFAQAAGFVTVFEEAGVSADSAIKALKFALKNLAEAGVDPKIGLQQIITEIQNLIAKGDDLGARNLAEERFGKGFPEILRAIKENRLEIEKLPGAIDLITPSIDNATSATQDFSEQWKKFKNELSTDVKPASEMFFSWLNGQMESLLDLTDKFKSAWHDLFEGDWWKTSGLGRMLSGLGFGPQDNSVPGGGGSSWGDNVDIFPSSVVGGINLATIPVAVQKYANNCIDASARIILSTAGVNLGEDEIEKTIARGGSIDSLASGLNKLNPRGKYVPLQGSGGSQQAMFNAIKQSIDLGVGSILNVAPGQSIGGQKFSDGHFIAVTGYGPDGSINLSDTANGKVYSVPAGEAFRASQGRGIVVGTGSGPRPPAGVGPTTTPPATTSPGIGNYMGIGPAITPAPKSGPLTPGWGSPTAAAPVGPGTSEFTPNTNRPSAADVGPANPNLAPVQMVPSPFGPQYGSIPSGATPGYGPTGQPGYYLPDPKRIESQTDSYNNAVDAIAEANQAIQDAKEAQAEAAQKAAEVENDIYSTSEERANAQKRLKNANDAVERAVKNAKRAEKSADDAEEELAQAKLGTFRENQKAQAAKQNGALGGGNLADDFGLSEGLPGLVKWFTTFAANMAMAPMIGSLSSVAAASPYQGGFGALGAFGAQNMANGLTPLGLSSGSQLGGLAPSIGPAPIGGSVGSAIPGLNPVGPGAVGGGVGPGDARPSTGMTSMSPQFGVGPGFQGLGGGGIGELAMQGLSAAAGGLDVMMPGAGMAAQTGIKLANRTAAYLGQVAGIGMGGLLETFLPHGSPDADPGKSWFGKLVGGLAGARPALPNKAGAQGEAGGAGQPAPPQTPEQAAKLQAQNGGGSAGGPMVNVENMNNYTPDGGHSLANQIGRMQMASYASGGAPIAI